MRKSIIILIAFIASLSFGQNSIEYVTENNIQSHISDGQIESIMELEADYYVAKWGSSTNSGTSWQDAFSSITDVQTAPMPSDIKVLVNEGVYTNNFYLTNDSVKVTFKAVGDVEFWSVSPGLRIGINANADIELNGFKIIVKDDSPSFKIYGNAISGNNYLTLRNIEMYKEDNSSYWSVNYPIIRIEVYDCYFHDISKLDVSNGIGGGLLHHPNKIKNSKFENIGVMRNQGFIYMNSTDKVIENCTFIDVICGTSAYWGGAFFGNTAYVNNCKFINCRNYRLTSSTSTTIKNCEIINSVFTDYYTSHISNTAVDEDSSSPGRTQFGDNIVEGDVKIRDNDRYYVGNVFVTFDGTNWITEINGTNYIFNLIEQ